MGTPGFPQSMIHFFIHISMSPQPHYFVILPNSTVGARVAKQVNFNHARARIPLDQSTTTVNAPGRH